MSDYTIEEVNSVGVSIQTCILDNRVVATVMHPFTESSTHGILYTTKVDDVPIMILVGTEDLGHLSANNNIDGYRDYVNSDDNSTVLLCGKIELIDINGGKMLTIDSSPFCVLSPHEDIVRRYHNAYPYMYEIIKDGHRRPIYTLMLDKDIHTSNDHVNIDSVIKSVNTLIDNEFMCIPPPMMLA